MPLLATSNRTAPSATTASRTLSRALERLLSDASLRQNMLRLKAFQDKVDGAAVAAREIVKFLGASKSRMGQAK